MFATIPYLVVEYDDGKEKQCNFKYEENVDRMLACIGKSHPEIRLVSRAAEERLKKREQERAERFLPELSKKHRERPAGFREGKRISGNQAGAWHSVKSVGRGKEPTTRAPELQMGCSGNLSSGAASLIYRIYSLINHVEFAVYFTLFGMVRFFGSPAPVSADLQE